MVAHALLMHWGLITDSKALILHHNGKSACATFPLGRDPKPPDITSTNVARTCTWPEKCYAS